MAHSSGATVTSYLQREPDVTTEHVENRCPHLASLSIQASSPMLMQINLAVDLEFGEHTSGMTAGMVRFSLSRATLNLELSGCQLPVGDRRLFSPHPAQTEIKR